MATLAGEASRLAEAVVTGEEKSYSTADRRLDKVLTGRRWGIPIMLGLLAVIFWLTISGANLPSALLANGLFRLQDLLSGALLGLDPAHVFGQRGPRQKNGDCQGDGQKSTFIVHDDPVAPDG